MYWLLYCPQECDTSVVFVIWWLYVYVIWFHVDVYVSYVSCWSICGHVLPGFQYYEKFNLGCEFSSQVFCSAKTAEEEALEIGNGGIIKLAIGNSGGGICLIV